MPSHVRRLLSQPHLLLIAIVGVVVPRRLRADWRGEWEAELRWREQRLAEWDRLGRRDKWDLFLRSTGALRDALWLQRYRLEDEVMQDVRFGLRLLVKNPAFTAVAVLTLAFGIGANSAVFTFLDALLWRPLAGVADADRLVQLGRQYPDKSYLSDSSYPDFLDYRRGNSVSGVAALAPRGFDLNTGDETERVEGELVSGDYFSVLGAAAAQGRLISPVDDQAGAPPVVVVSHRLWQRRYDGNPSAVGATIDVDGHPFTIIGVAAEPFRGVKVGTPRDVWLPLAAIRTIDPASARFGARRSSWLEAFARLRPGVSVEQARAEFSVIAERLARTYPETNAGVGIGVEPGLGRDIDVRRALRRFAYVPLTAVAIVLLIACANTAGLLLARAAARRREIATRFALGAGRARVFRQLLTESLMLAMASGVVGLAVARWLTKALTSLLPERFLFLSFGVDLGINWRVFGFTLAVAAVTGLVFGLVPALEATRPDSGAISRALGIRGGRRSILIRRFLVVAQVGFSVILLIGAALCVATLRNAAAIDKGYDPGPVLTARLDLAKQRYDDTRARMFQRQLLERLHGTPGVEAAAFAVTLPLNDGRWEDAVRREGDPSRMQSFQNVVSPRYFEAMHIPLAAGRFFTERDDARSPRVAMLNETLAHSMWPGEDAIGKRLSTKGELLEVIGVVADIKGRNLFEPPDPMLYLPLYQWDQPNTVLHVRTASRPTSLAAALRREMRRLDPNVPLYDVRPMDEHVAAALTPQRLLAYLISGFGSLALLLAAIGMYGLLAYAVTERTAEIGVRMAMGARRIDVMRLFVMDGMTLAVSGILVGIAGALELMPLLDRLLFGIRPLDPMTFVGVPMLLLGAAFVACTLPARRAARADPNVALRYE